MNLFFKGLLIGLGKIIPGVSGSLIAISLNEYENMIHCINNIFNKKSIIYLIKISLGIIISIIIGSNLILYLINKYELFLYTIFTILILLTIPKLLKEVNNYLYTIITIIIILSIYLIDGLNFNNNYFVVGLIESVSMIIPGLSGTAIYNSLGLYDEILNLMSTIYLLDFREILPFSIGLLIGTISSIKLIDYCFSKYKSETYSVILGLVISSVCLMLIKR